jgi:hypothetical protein
MCPEQILPGIRAVAYNCNYATNSAADVCPNCNCNFNCNEAGVSLEGAPVIATGQAFRRPFTGGTKS